MIVVDAALLAHYVGSAYISINPTLYTHVKPPSHVNISIFVLVYCPLLLIKGF